MNMSFWAGIGIGLAVGLVNGFFLALALRFLREPKPLTTGIKLPPEPVR